jgi:hypothetical protein
MTSLALKDRPRKKCKTGSKAPVYEADEQQLRLPLVDALLAWRGVLEVCTQVEIAHWSQGT